LSKVILIYPKFPIQEGPKFNVPMGPLHLGTYLEDKGIRSVFIDGNIEDSYEDLLREELLDCTCVGISAMTSQLPDALAVCALIKKKFNSDIPIVFGGVHATLFPVQTVNNYLIDYAVIGEGEDALYNLIMALEGKEDFENVEGLVYRDSDNNTQVIRKSHNFDFSTMPVINYRLLSKQVLEQFEENFVGMITSRGCPHRCTFCINTVVKENKKWRTWDTEKTMEEIESLLSLGCNKIYFWDENFFVNKKRVEEILDNIESKKLKFEWFANVRADYFKDSYLNSDALKRLYNAGCRRFGIGAESGSQRMLDYMCKDITVEQILNSARQCETSGIRPTYSFMIGLPGEKKEDAKLTIDIIGNILKLCSNARILGPQLFRPYPGSDLYLECLKSGLKEPVSLEDWSKAIMTDFMESNPYQMPWIEDPEFVNIAWFYSLFLSASAGRICQLFIEYCRVYKKGLLFSILGLLGVIILIGAGRVRYKFGFGKFAVEISLFKKYRSVISC